MKTRILAAILSCAMLFVPVATASALDIDYAALSDEELSDIIRDASAERTSRQTRHVPVAVDPSPDKYTWHVRDYVGRNAASFGYTSLGGGRLEEYGAGHLSIKFVAEDGMYIDIEDDDVLRQYVVTGQNIAPNTQMKLVFLTDSKGEEYSNLVDYQSVNEIDLTVRRIDGTLAGDPVAFDLTPIQPSPDKYTWYIRNYVGKNVASIGYTSLGGDLRDEYGHATIRFNLVSNDGAYIDPDDDDILRQYVVTGQDIAPNSKMTLVMMKDSKGEEYSNLVDTQSYENITLYVRKLDVAFPETPSASVDTAVPIVTDASVHSYKDVQYRLLADGDVEICGCTSAKSSITIPSEIDGRDVTRIGDGAFENCTALKTLNNWADLTTIGASAFKGCTKLKEISIPGETTFIGEAAFEGCSSLKTVIIWGDPTSVERNTFKDCVKLRDISIPSSATFIGESAFENCKALDSVIIWGDITRVGRNAFKNCENLKDISVPSSAEVIEESAFEGCVDLKSVILWGDTNIGASAFRNCAKLKEISISSDTEYIGDYAFEGCQRLENVILWGRSTQIGKDAFANCPRLKNVPQ